MTNKPLLTVNWNQSYDNVSDEIKKEGRACIDLDAIQDGVIKEIGANRLGLLLVIVSCMDKEGKAFPSQRKLAQLTGQSVNTVNKLINELLEKEVNGQKILRRELTGTGARKKSMYFINGGAVTNSDDEPEKEAKESEWNSKDFAFYFAELYEEEYGQGYAINYGRDIGLVKKKLMPNFDEETLKAVIQIAITKYKEKWGNEKYPLPTIPMLASWIANQAYAVYQQEQDKKQKQAQKETSAVEQDESDKFFDIL